MELSVRLKVAEASEKDELPRYRVRTLCRWTDISELSEVFGEGDLGWEAPSEETEGDEESAAVGNEKKKLVCSGDLKRTISADMKDKEVLGRFNADPGVYVMVIKEEMQEVVKPPVELIEGEEPPAEPEEPEMELHLIPTGFLYLDPSCFLLNKDETLTSCVRVADGVYAEMTLDCGESFLCLQESFPLEPLVLSFDSVDGYPVSTSATKSQAMESVYVSGVFETGIGNDSRRIYIRPSATDSGYVDENGNYRIPLQFQVIMLPGIGNVANFREGLRSKTYTVEVHREDIFGRAFSDRVINDYHVALVGGEDVEDKRDPLAQATGKITEADEVLMKGFDDALAQSSCINQHGLARYRLERLLDTSVDILKEFARKREEGEALGEQNVLVTDDVFADVRTAQASKPERWKPPSDVSLLKSLRKERGNADIKKKVYVRPFHEMYDDFNTMLYMSVKMHRFLGAIKEPPPRQVTPEMLEVAPFTRTVLAFDYQDDTTLLKVNEALTKVNKIALSNIQGSIRSYSFTDEEMEACVNGGLDVITGFMVIDNDTRIIVLEGLAGPEKGMESVVRDLPRLASNNKHLSMLANPNILFQKRLYGEFGPDLKRIRIRNALPKLARKPEVYNRKLVSEQCFEAIDHVMHLRWAPDLLSTKELEMFPSAASLNTVELLYGEAISRADLDGVGAEPPQETTKKGKKKKKPSRDTIAAQEISNYMAAGDTQSAGEGAGKTTILTHNLPPTDSKNPEYEEYLATRPRHRVDYLAEQRTLLEDAYINKEERVSKREAESKYVLQKVFGDENARIHVYACQKENFKIKSYSALRQRILEKGGDSTYTFSKDLLAGTVAAVDPEELKKKQANPNLVDKSRWLTQTGMQYPKPKTRKDLITHPKRPSDSRIDELNEPWILDLPEDMQDPNSKFDPTDPGYIHDLRLEKGYTTRIQGGNDFGALRPADYQREFQLKHVGDRKKLPRGGLTQGDKGDMDPWAFRSVHLQKPEVTKQILEAQEQDKKDWLAKVKVDSLSFKVDGFVTRDKTLQIKRTDDILHDAPVREELIHLRNRTSELGTDFSYAPPPLSIFKGEPYVANAAANAMTRHVDKTKFITSSKPGEKGADFNRFIDKYASAPRLVKLIHNRKHPPQDSTEHIGAKWGGNTSK